MKRAHPDPSNPPHRAVMADAVEVLRRGQQALGKLFFAFHLLCERDDTAQGKRAMIERVYVELMVHLQLVGEVVHPALQQQGSDVHLDLIAEARSAHRSAREMLASIVGSPVENAARDARVEALGEFMERQFEHERSLLFPVLRQSDLKLDELGRVLLDRRQALLVQYERVLSHGVVVEDEADDPVGRPSDEA